MWATSQFSKPPDRALPHFLNFHRDPKKSEIASDFREVIIKKNKINKPDI